MAPHVFARRGGRRCDDEDETIGRPLGRTSSPIRVGPRKRTVGVESNAPGIFQEDVNGRHRWLYECSICEHPSAKPPGAPGAMGRLPPRKVPPGSRYTFFLTPPVSLPTLLLN